MGTGSLRLKYRDKQRLIALCNNVDWLIDRLEKKTLSDSERTHLYRICARKKYMSDKLKGSKNRGTQVHLDRTKYTRLQKYVRPDEGEWVQEKEGEGDAGTGITTDGDSTRT